MKLDYFRNKNKSTLEPLAIGLILIVAFVLRVWDLGLKPPHFDEGINGHFVAKMFKDGFYLYDPSNFHGPLYFYFLQLAEILFGRNIVGFRFINGLISLGIVALVAKHRRFFGSAAIWAALLIAVSPGFTFYSRYAIHESLFILLQIIFVYGYFLWKEKPSHLAFAYMVTGFFGTFAVKETFFIFFGTWAIAIGCVEIAERIFPSDKTPPPEPVKLSKKERKLAEAEEKTKVESERIPTSDLISMVIIGAIVTIMLFSGFMMNKKGIADMFGAFAFWTKTGSGGSGHEKPILYYIDLFWRYEWPFLLGLIVTPVIFFFVNRPARLMIMVGFGTFLAYAIIPYKTPWLILNVLWLLAFTVGFFLKRASEVRGEPAVIPLNIVATLIVLFAVATTVKTTLRLNFRDYAKGSEPYVYVQSTYQFKTVMDLIQAHLKLRPEDLNKKVLVLNKDTWPLPWMFSLYPKLAYGKADDADVSGAMVVTVDESSQGVIETKLKGKYWKFPFQIRDAYNNGSAYLEYEAFRDLVPAGTTVVEGSAK